MRRLPLLSSLLPLLLWHAEPAGQTGQAAQQAGSARFKRRAVEGVSSLAQYGGLSRLQCAARCSRLPACVAWWQDPTGDTCSLWEISEEGQTALTQSNAFVILPPYWIVRERRKWSDILAGCREADPRGRPAVPTSDAGMTELKNLAGYHHVGLRCTSGTSYVDAEGHPVTVKGSWFNGGVVQSCTNSAYECAVLYAAGLYLSACDRFRWFVCEIQNPVP